MRRGRPTPAKATEATSNSASAGRIALAFLQRRQAAILSLALSLTVIGIVALMAATSNQRAAAGPPDEDFAAGVLAAGQGHGGYAMLSESGQESVASSLVLRGASVPTLTFTVLGHGDGTCTIGTNVEPFTVPCSGDLPQDTMLYIFDPAPGTMVDTRNPSALCGSCPVTIRNSGSGKVKINLDNLTATPMQAQVLLGFGAIVVGGSDTMESPLSFIANSGSGAFDLSVFGFVPQSLTAAATTQELGMAELSPSPITATMVISFGPTGRISQVLAFAPPESVYVPLATRALGTGW